MEIYIAKSGKESGPFTKDQVVPMLESGMVDLVDSVWHEGLSEWQPVHEFLSVPLPDPQPALAPNSASIESHIHCPSKRSSPRKLRVTLLLLGVFAIALFSNNIVAILQNRDRNWNILMTGRDGGVRAITLDAPILKIKTDAYMLPFEDANLGGRIWNVIPGKRILRWGGATLSNTLAIPICNAFRERSVQGQRFRPDGLPLP